MRPTVKDYKQLDMMFAAFQEAYPRDLWTNERHAREQFYSLDPAWEFFRATILAAVLLQKRSGKKMPSPGWWLHDRRWQDAPEAYRARLCRKVPTAAELGISPEALDLARQREKERRAQELAGR